VYHYDSQGANIGKCLSIRNKRYFRTSPVSYKIEYCSENRGLCFLNLGFLHAGYYYKPRPLSDNALCASLLQLYRNGQHARLDYWSEYSDATDTAGPPSLSDFKGPLEGFEETNMLHYFL